MAKPVLHRRDHEHGGADPVRIVWESTGAGAGGGEAFAAASGPFTPGSAVTLYDFDSGGSVYSGTTGSSFTVASGVASITQPGFYVCTLFATVKMNTSPTSDETFVIEIKYGSADLGFTIEPRGGTPTPSSPLWTVVIPAGTSTAFEANLQRTRPLSVTDAVTFPVDVLPYLRVSTPGHMVFEWVSLWGYRVGGDLGAAVSD